MSKNVGGSAFPCAETQYSDSTPGMTLRDYFVAHVEVELDIPIKEAELIAGRPCPGWQADYIGNIKFWAEVEAIVRGIKADAMIAERNKQ